MSLLNFLQQRLYMSQQDIIKFARTSPYRYKLYTIPKRNGQGVRLIAHPSVQLKFIQRLVVEYLSNIITIHHNAYAYRKGIGIRENAKQHLNSKYLLKMDFKDFFPSICPELLIKKLRNSNVDIDEIDEQLLGRLLFCRYNRDEPLKLSVGAPSSPFISNFIMAEFDEILSNYCNELDIVYTRYADDITFSTKKARLLFSIPDNVRKLLNETTNGFISINDEKTLFSSKAHNRHVTGIVLTNDNKLSLGRDKKRQISATIHHYVQGTLCKESIRCLKGHLAHAIYIEPDFYDRMCKKYGLEQIEKLIRTSYE